jgi:DNA repair protein RecO (recombination protein O)
MPEWTDNAIIISSRPFGEDAAVVQVLTEHHGRHAGLVRGGQSRKMRPVLQPGNEVSITWRARLDEHLGSMGVELQAANAARILDDRLRLTALSSLCALVQGALAEREPADTVYDASLAMINLLASETEAALWLAAYIRWEIGLLSVAGFGLDLDRCVVSGENHGLEYVSPRSGGAVTAVAAGDHAPRLLVLPGFLGGPRKSLEEDVINGIRMTGHFIGRQIFGIHHLPMAEARQRLEDLVMTEFDLEHIGQDDTPIVKNLDEDKNNG